uniref:Uncharacterized protein n=1 Tax=Aegilops tauschii subsp. strangulata TaxID=200361 RepID=A0A452YMM7_AEGTS
QGAPNHQLVTFPPMPEQNTGTERAKQKLIKRPMAQGGD